MKKRVDKKSINKQYKFSLREQYKKGFDFITESRKFIYAIIIIFFVFVLIGFFVPVSESLANSILEYLKEIVSQTEGMSQSQLIWFIFENNSTNSFFGIVLGIFLGVFPVIVSIFNGYILGFVGRFVVDVAEGNVSVLLNFLPHGIFELPVVFISFGMGMKLGTFIFQKNKFKSFLSYLLNSLRVFILIVIPLLIIAAIIEGSFMIVFG